MKTIEIKYHRFLFGENTLTTEIPTSWNELTADQLAFIAGLLHSNQDMDKYQFRILVIKKLLKLKWHHILILKDRIVDLYPFFSWIEEENTLTENKFPVIKLEGIEFYGPIGDFETLTADEWTEADTAFMDYNESKDISDLDRMISCLWRERSFLKSPESENWEGDYRIKFSEHRVKLIQTYIKKMDVGIKYAILTWYMGCRQDWEKLFERVFKENQMAMESFGWQETIQKLSGSAFGNLQETMITPMYKLLLNMEITIKDDEFRKEQERHQKLVKR